MTRIVNLKFPTEESEQIMFATWLLKKGIRFTSSANGGSRNLFEAIKLKRMGVSAGFPDVEIPYPLGGYHGLYIELKRIKTGKVRENQIEWINFLRSQGYKAEIAYGFDEAKAIVSEYFSTLPDAA